MSTYTPGLSWTTWQSYWPDYYNNASTNKTLPVIPMPPTPSLPVNGVTQSYTDPVIGGSFDGSRYVNAGTSSDLSTLNLGTQQSIQENTGNTHQFSIRWMGYIYTQTQNGTWYWNFSTDNQSAIWIGSSSLNTNVGSMQYNATDNGTREVGNGSRYYLPPNTYVPITIWYGEQGGAWSANIQTINPAGTNLNGTTGWYFSRSNNTAIISDIAINFSNCIL